MAVLKCKMCGGALDVNSNETVAVCRYCGTAQTLPRLSDERKADMYDRANHFRRNNEFDKAMGMYENILLEDNTDAESYWSLVLCRYGIEYVKDPSSLKMVPTINRAQYTSVFDDDNYKSAIRYADTRQRSIYEEEARVINELQKGILLVSGKEEPFDVFICYKESDEGGRRTPDSVLAAELYRELTREGYKVFFSRITLEDKLGTAYEPYIFAALNSSKVMVVIGTKPEYFNAAWVRNEWSRYLALIKNGAKKVLIPAYRDMDPYNLPEEFSHLQAQDMSRLGFMQDLVRGINKIVDENKEKQIIHETVITSEATGNVSALMKRGYMALEDGEWAKADDFFEQCLNQDAELSEAYLGKLMAELHVRTREGLRACEKPFDGSNNYQKTVRFADSSLAAFLTDTIAFINDRNKTEALEAAYNRAEKLMGLGQEAAFSEARACFEKISGYKDSDALAKECGERAEALRRERVYNSACEVLSLHTWVGKKTDIKAHEEAIEKFRSLNGFKDSEEKILLCQKKIEELKLKAEKDRQEKELREEAARLKAKKIKRAAAIVIPSAFVLLVAFIIFITVANKVSRYNDAKELLILGHYEEAAALLEKLNGYKDSEELLDEAHKLIKNEADYKLALELLDEKTVKAQGKAYEKLLGLGDYKNAKELLAGFQLREISEKTFYANSKKTDITTYRYSLSGFQITEIYNGNLYYYTYEFNDKGQLLKQRDENGNVSEYRYHPNGELSYSSYARVFDMDGKCEGFIETEYDTNGMPVVMKDDYDDIKWTYNYLYDEDGSIISVDIGYKEDDKEGSLTVDIKEQGLEIIVDSEGFAAPKYRFVTEDGKKEITYKVEWNGSELVFFEYEATEYDEHHNRIVLTYHNIELEKTFEDTYQNTYNEKGQLISCVYKDGDSVNYTYDDNGNVIGNTYIDADGSISGSIDITYGYVYVPYAE